MKFNSVTIFTYSEVQFGFNYIEPNKNETTFEGIGNDLAIIFIWCVYKFSH